MKFEKGLSYTDWSPLMQDFSIEAKTSTWILSGTSKHGWVGSNGILAQPINLLVNTDYTFSGRVLKSTPAGFVKIELYHADTDMLVHQIARYEEPFDGSFLYQFNTGNIGRYKLVVTIANASTTNPIEITDLMLARGKNYSVWSQASGEVYTLNVKVDSNGINVLSVDGRSRTVMSPEEFAGYYNDEKIFTLNKDITEVLGLYVRGKGMYIPPVKFVQTNNSLDVVWTGREVI